MAIVSADIKLKLSIVTGAAGNAATQPDPNVSLGKYISTLELSATPLNNLFDNVSGDENAASVVDYRCIFVHNSHATLTLTAPVAYLSAEVAGGANIAIAIDNLVASAIGSAAAQAALIANEITGPTGVGAFSSPTTKAAGLAVGDLAPGFCRAIWVRRTATNSAALDADGVTLAVAGDTAA